VAFECGGSAVDFSFIEEMDCDSEFHEEVAPDVWLVQDHKWAFWVWEKTRSQDPAAFPLPLVHLDYHWDSVNDWHEPEHEREILELGSLSDVERMILPDHLGRSSIQRDNFIAPALIRKLIDEVHFLCLQRDTDQGFWPPDIARLGFAQYIYDDLRGLLSSLKDRELLFDLDIDLFNTSGMWAEDEYWPVSDIIAFLEECGASITRARVVTVAISLGFSGSAKGARRLTELVMREVLRYRVPAQAT